MAVTADLEEDEAYLFALLTDPSGIDQAEFLIYDPSATETDEIYRCWGFQWKWYSCTDRQQIDQCGRAVGKSQSIRIRGFIFPLLYPNREMLITAPELVHLEPVTRQVEMQIQNVRLTRELLPKNRSSITHRPFEMDFVNGARIVGRIPQRDGKGVKGAHPLWLELDEASDFPEPGWVELIETLNRAQDGAIWRAHGVTRGVRDYFYKFTQPESGWTVHRYTGMHRPTWTAEEREEKIEAYGSKDAPDYRRNILGLHGDATNPLFVLHRLMAATDTDETSDYNKLEYRYTRINAERLLDVGGNFEMLLSELPRIVHPDDHGYWIGCDVGYTNHPTEILCFVERKSPKRDPYLQLMSRIHLERVSHGDQVGIILWLTRFYDARAFSMDKTGLGLPLFQDIQERATDVAERIKGYNFSAKILVDFDKTITVDPMLGDPVKEAGIERNVLQYSCVDEETQALSQSGWKSYKELAEGDLIYTLDTATGLARWSPVEAVQIYRGSIPVVEYTSRVHSSVTTPDHKWWISRRQTHTGRVISEWRATKDFVNAVSIPLCAPPDPQNFPSEPKLSNALVELLGWVWTEGWWMRGRRDWCGLMLGQSDCVNPENVKRIRAILDELFPSGFSERTDEFGMVRWYLYARNERTLRPYFTNIADKVLDVSWLSDLTASQLELFIQTSVLADGWNTTGRPGLSQSLEQRLEAYVMACILAGYAVHLFDDGGGTQCRCLVREVVQPHAQAATKSSVAHRQERTTDLVWCPTTRDRTFLARRHGCVYFTGNSDKLRDLVDKERILFPWDKELIREFQGQTYTIDKSGMDMYGRKRYSQGSFHALDAARMAVLGWAQHSIEELMKTDQRQDVVDQFVSW